MVLSSHSHTMKKEQQAEITDEIIHAALFLDGRKMKVGEAYEKIAKRRGDAFREKVKELPSESFSTSRMALGYRADPSPIQQALEYRKNMEGRK